MTGALGRAIVFLGPSLDLARARRLLAADYRPPAAKGDLYDAVKERPQVIGLIDGYFQGRPAVWHKEILFALSQGIPVFGAASMGALRAAEMQGFGMIGVGEVFRRYAAGGILGDDEVAVEHGPAGLGYPLTSVALVDIRATLQRACEETVLPEIEAARLEAIAAARFYPLRRWEWILEEAQKKGLPEPLARRFAGWLKEGAVSQKALDAEALLKRLRRMPAEERRGADPAPAFEATLLWELLVEEKENPVLRSLAAEED